MTTAENPFDKSRLMELAIKVREFVEHCYCCGGTGTMDVWDLDPRDGPRREMLEPCPYCSDLRIALAEAVDPALEPE